MHLVSERPLPGEPLELEPFDWDELLSLIKERRVVPVVGRELLVMEGPDPGALLESQLAGELAAELGVRTEHLPQPLELHRVAFEYLERRRDQNRAYSRTKLLLDKLLPRPSELLLQLAAIPGFDLFLSTTVDGLLVTALDQVRYGGRRETLDLAFSPYRQVENLPPQGLPPGSSAVYRLFGRASPSRDFALTEADLLEFVHALQSDRRRPNSLFDFLRDRHLLFLGCGFPDWLARFFIRTIKDEPFVASDRARSEMVVDRRLQNDPDLILFLRHFDTKVMWKGGAAQFVPELLRRWREATPATAAPLERRHQRRMAENAVFLSYAREDRLIVQRVADALEAAGIDAWFDERALDPGADFDADIRENILRCSLFLPFISRHTEAVRESYFRAEWHYAITRAFRIARSVPFILPVAVDDVSESGPHIPLEFRERHWFRLEQGQQLPSLVDEVRRQVRRLRASQYE
jgi:hypothetical protein